MLAQIGRQPLAQDLGQLKLDGLARRDHEALASTATDNAALAGVALTGVDQEVNRAVGTGRGP